MRARRNYPQFPPTKHKGKEENSTARFSTKKLLKGTNLQANLTFDTLAFQNPWWFQHPTWMKTSISPAQFATKMLPHRARRGTQRTRCPKRRNGLPSDDVPQSPLNISFLWKPDRPKKNRTMLPYKAFWVRFIIHDRAATYLMSHEPQQKNIFFKNIITLIIQVTDRILGLIGHVIHA